MNVYCLSFYSLLFSPHFFFFFFFLEANNIKRNITLSRVAARRKTTPAEAMSYSRVQRLPGVAYGEGRGYRHEARCHPNHMKSNAYDKGLG